MHNALMDQQQHEEQQNENCSIQILRCEKQIWFDFML